MKYQGDKTIQSILTGAKVNIGVDKEMWYK